MQRAVDTLQAAVDFAAMLNSAKEYLVAILNLTKAYEKVVRGLLITKLEKMGIPKNLENQIIVFLVPMLVQTAGDVTHTVAVLTTGLTQGGSAYSGLFRIFIDDLAKALRKAQGKDGELEGGNLQELAKLVADDVIILSKDDDELQELLDTCTQWAEINCLVWKPQK